MSLGMFFIEVISQLASVFERKVTNGTLKVGCVDVFPVVLKKNLISERNGTNRTFEGVRGRSFPFFVTDIMNSLHMNDNVFSRIKMI